MITIPMTIETQDVPVDISINADDNSAQLGLSTQYHVYPQYDGPTVIVPTQSYQIIRISGKVSTQDIIVNPIPSNYGS